MKLLHHQHHHFLFSFPKTPNPNPNSTSFRAHHHRQTLPWRPLLLSPPPRPNCFPSEEFPVDDTFLEQFAPKDKLTEEEARFKNWTERGWAPWEEVLTPEADFARKSLNEGEEVPLQTPEAIEAFKMLKPSYRKKKMEEMGLTEDDYYRKQFEIKNVPEPLVTSWISPLVLRHLPPRDWPPRGWEVDREELEFIREAHKLEAERVDLEGLEGKVVTVSGSDEMCLDRYKMFLKQYKEYVAANKDRLEEESYKEDQDYYPGRRKRGKDYEEGLYELPFFSPGQICAGIVTTVHLYQGAFVNINGVHEGWVPIKGNDWFWIRHHVKVGMFVIVEILAKRDPYRFRFPIEMRFLDPNIDHLIFNRSEFPPIFHRDQETDKQQLMRDSGRPPVPRKRPNDNPVEEDLLSNHPYVEKLWQIHVAEQMIINDVEMNPDKYKGKKLSELSDDEELNEENSTILTKAPYKNTEIPKVILKTSVKDLELEAAFAERQIRNKKRMEAEKRGEKYKPVKMKRNNEMDEYNKIHLRRSFEERQAFIRDIACRQALGLPVEEPGRYEEVSSRKNEYDPDSPLYRYDYWGEPKNSEKSKQERIAESHNKAIIGNSTLWYSTSYEDCIKDREEREAKGIVSKLGEDEDLIPDDLDDDDDDEEDDDFDFSLLSDTSLHTDEQPYVNGTQSSSISDEGIFEE